jgi:hypothetical protein
MLHNDAEGLTDDFELPFDGGAQEGIGGVVFEAFPFRKVSQQVAGARTSNNHARGSRGIQQLPRRLDTLAKIGVANSAEFDEIDATSQ